MALNVDKTNLTIMGVKFDFQKEFNGVWQALSTNMIEDWEPKKQDVEEMKGNVAKKRSNLMISCKIDSFFTCLKNLSLRLFSTPFAIAIIKVRLWQRRNQRGSRRIHPIRVEWRGTIKSDHEGEG